MKLRKKTLKLFPVVCLFLIHPLFGQTDSVTIFRINDTLMVDAGHCPGEGCIYGTWKAHQNIPFYNAPYDTVSKGMILSGESFEAVTGNVFFVPEIIILTETDYKDCLFNESGSIPAHNGDTLFVLTNIGEGHYKIKIGRTYGLTTCRENDNYEQWWVKIFTKEGREGWILNEGLKISGSDAFE